MRNRSAVLISSHFKGVIAIASCLSCFGTSSVADNNYILVGRQGLELNNHFFLAAEDLSFFIDDITFSGL